MVTLKSLRTRAVKMIEAGKRAADACVQYVLARMRQVIQSSTRIECGAVTLVKNYHERNIPRAVAAVRKLGGVGPVRVQYLVAGVAVREVVRS